MAADRPSTASALLRLHNALLRLIGIDSRFLRNTADRVLYSAMFLLLCVYLAYGTYSLATALSFGSEGEADRSLGAWIAGGLITLAIVAIDVAVISRVPVNYARIEDSKQPLLGPSSRGLRSLRLTVMMVMVGVFVLPATVNHFDRDTTPTLAASNAAAVSAYIASGPPADLQKQIEALEKAAPAEQTAIADLYDKATKLDALSAKTYEQAKQESAGKGLTGLSRCGPECRRLIALAESQAAQAGTVRRQAQTKEKALAAALAPQALAAAKAQPNRASQISALRTSRDGLIETFRTGQQANTGLGARVKALTTMARTDPIGFGLPVMIFIAVAALLEIAVFALKAATRGSAYEQEFARHELQRTAVAAATDTEQTTLLVNAAKAAYAEPAIVRSAQQAMQAGALAAVAEVQPATQPAQGQPPESVPQPAPESAQQTAPGSAQQPVQQPGRRHVWAGATAGVVAVALIAGAVYSLTDTRSDAVAVAATPAVTTAQGNVVIPDTGEVQLALPSGGTLRIPQGAIDPGAAVAATRPGQPTPEPKQNPSKVPDTAGAGEAVSLTATPAEAVKGTMSVTFPVLAGAADWGTPTVSHFDETTRTWQEVPSTYDPVAGTVSAQTRHFSWWRPSINLDDLGQAIGQTFGVRPPLPECTGPEAPNWATWNVTGSNAPLPGCVRGDSTDPDVVVAEFTNNRNFTTCVRSDNPPVFAWAADGWNLFHDAMVTAVDAGAPSLLGDRNTICVPPKGRGSLGFKRGTWTTVTAAGNSDAVTAALDVILAGSKIDPKTLGAILRGTVNVTDGEIAKAGEALTGAAAGQMPCLGKLAQMAGGGAGVADIATAVGELASCLQKATLVSGLRGEIPDAATDTWYGRFGGLAKLKVLDLVFKLNAIVEFAQVRAFGEGFLSITDVPKTLPAKPKAPVVQAPVAQVPTVDPAPQVERAPNQAPRPREPAPEQPPADPNPEPPPAESAPQPQPAEPARIELTQGGPAQHGSWYSVQLTGFAPSSQVTLYCHDTVSASFYDEVVTISGDGRATDAQLCFSNDGPGHWVTSNTGVESNQVTWGPAQNAPVQPAPSPAGVIELRQGGPAQYGSWYSAQLSGFSPGSQVTLYCHDTVSAAFYDEVVTIGGDGRATDAQFCFSADGPDRWVTSSTGVESNHVTW